MRSARARLLSLLPCSVLVWLLLPYLLPPTYILDTSLNPARNVAPLSSQSWPRLQAVLSSLPLPDKSPGRSGQVGCRPPHLDPWNPQLQEYFKEPRIPYHPHSTSNLNSLLFISEDKLHLSSSTLRSLGLSWGEVECTYSYVSPAFSPWHVAYGEGLPPSVLSDPPVVLSPNFTSVTARCTYSSREIFSRLLFYVPAPPPGPRPHPTPTHRKKYSVLLFILDGVSQLAAHRCLPLTLTTASALGSVVFRGHHKVGLNSMPNVMGLLTGSSNLTDKPWLANYTKLAWQPMVTNLFHDSGWTTLLLHDELWMGLSLVFNRAPNPFDISFNAGFRRWKKWGRRHSDPTDLVRDFTLMYRDRPIFAHVHLSEYTHNDLNGAKSYDRDLALKLRVMAQSGSLDDTFLVLMGDHGYRFGDFSKTSQGNTENNMPLLLVMPPKSLEQEQPELVRNLRHNSEVLTSHWDLHQTLRHVLALGVGQELVDASYSGSLSPGSSLLSPLQARTCREAAVSLWFCSCPEEERVLETGAVAPLLEAGLQDINSFLQPLGLGCQHLQMDGEDSVTNAHVKFEGDKVLIEAFVLTKARGAQLHFQILFKPNNPSFSLQVAFSSPSSSSLYPSSPTLVMDQRILWPDAPQCRARLPPLSQHGQNMALLHIQGPRIIRD